MQHIFIVYFDEVYFDEVFTINATFFYFVKKFTAKRKIKYFTSLQIYIIIFRRRHLFMILLYLSALYDHGVLTLVGS